MTTNLNNERLHHLIDLAQASLKPVAAAKGAIAIRAIIDGMIEVDEPVLLTKSELLSLDFFEVKGAPGYYSKPEGGYYDLNGNRLGFICGYAEQFANFISDKCGL